jgi:hypothetical protein
MEAGSDTTSATLLSFCLAMTKYPEVLKKCQAEVDAVSPDRTPTIKDVNNLPYIRAAMNEVHYPLFLIIVLVYLSYQELNHGLSCYPGPALASRCTRWHSPCRNRRRYIR